MRKPWVNRPSISYNPNIEFLANLRVMVLRGQLKSDSFHPLENWGGRWERKQEVDDLITVFTGCWPSWGCCTKGTVDLFDWVVELHGGVVDYVSGCLRGSF